MKVYITGVRGFLGTHLAKALSDDGWEVMGCDLMKPETEAWEALSKPKPYVIDHGWIEYAGFMSNCLDHFKPDIVVHLAARSTVEVAWGDPVPAFETNVMGTVHVLDACRTLKIPCIVASSDKAYGARRAPFFEEDTPLKPNYPYDVSKAAADMIALSYARTYKMSVTVTRACNIYGPGDLHWNRLVPKSFKLLAEGERPVIYGPMAGVRREWTHVSDAVAAYRAIMDRVLKDPEYAGLAYNIGTNQILTLRDMVYRILIAASARVEPIIGVAGYPELGDEWLNHGRLERLGWEPKVKLDDGLAETWAWYKEFVTKGGT